MTDFYGALTVESGNPKVATATVSGTNIVVKGISVGTSELTITAAGDASHNAATIKCKVNVAPGVTSKFTAAPAADGKGLKLTWAKVPGATNYVIYRNGKRLPTVGNITTLTDTGANSNGAKYTYKIYAKATTGTCSQYKSVVYYKLNRPAIRSLTNSASGKITARWSRNSRTSGYQVQYCLANTFKGAKTATLNKNSVGSKTFTNLTKGKTYYVRMRSFKRVSGTTYFSAWSESKKIKITK